MNVNLSSVGLLFIALTAQIALFLYLGVNPNTNIGLLVTTYAVLVSGTITYKYNEWINS